ncbi:hypothetical protein FACS189472_08730 [Alphaproteobacteria bacterium]|nr:hypothetical protein FACS189472_08730 [Alphaproteobacteria bacterium]
MKFLWDVNLHVNVFDRINAFIFVEMVGEYSKSDLILRSLKRKYPYDNVELTLKKPKIIYNQSTLGLPPEMTSWMNSVMKSQSQSQTQSQKQNIYADARDTSNTIGNVNSGISAGTSIISKASKAVDLAKDIGIGVPQTVSTLATTASEIGKVAGPVLGAVGAAASGVSLGFDIANAKKEGKVTFDNAMKMADDGTGLVAGIAGMLPGPGTAVGVALNVGEKIVTAPFKAYHAVKEEEKREGVKHLSAGKWVRTVLGEFTPKWWSLDIGSKEWKDYWKEDKAKRKAAAEQRKKEKAERKAERKEIWKHGTSKQKAYDFFFG